MQAYISSIELEKRYYPEKESIVVNFSGNNFANEQLYSKEHTAFREESLVFLKDVKKQISDFCMHSDSIVFSGGEPCLQRMALLELARHSKKEGLRTILETNCSKSATINSLLRANIMDIIILKLDAPFSECIFQKITKSGNFFISAKDVISEIESSIDMLSKSKEKLFIESRTRLLDDIEYTEDDINTIAIQIEKLSCPWRVTSNCCNPLLLSKIKSACQNFMIDVEII